MGIIAAFMVPHPPLIVPNVGKGGEEQIKETTKSYEAVAKKIAELKPETIVITSPHSVMYADYFHISPGTHAEGDFANFNAPEVKFNETYDKEFTSYLSKLADERLFPAGILGERDPNLDHGTMVPLYFIEKYITDFKLVRIGLSGQPLTDHYRLGKMIQETADALNKRVVLVASGDLSHKLQDYGPYGFSKEGPEYDDRIMKDAESGNFEAFFDYSEDFCEKAAECGHRSFVIMAGALDSKKLDIKKYSHQDVTGVGYGICSFIVTGEDENRKFLDSYLDKRKKKLTDQRNKEDAFVRLARASLEHFIKEKHTYGVNEAFRAANISKEDEEKLLSDKAGAFVSIHKSDRLRGCIGTFLPTQYCLAEEIIANAVSASTRDPRFDPITEEELEWLEISVDVLGTPEDIESEAELDPKKYGVIVRNGARRGLLLPDLPGVDTVEDQISIAKQKADIGKHEEVSLQRFTVTRHI